ncbi:MAG: gliding motility protein GldL [Bacteroidales bacterium]|nr:gliding motility protein GldL [Bacteroidales bacterium]
MAKKKPFNQTLGWKKFISMLYGFGASIVIVGALFKIQHYPGAGFMLGFGLLTEAVIFFFSAFEPLPAEYHWQNVYPELLTDPDDLEEEGGAPVSKNKLMGAAAPASDGKAFAELNKMIEDCAGKNVFQNLGQNFAKFNESVTDLKDVANSAAASKDFEANLRTASDSLKSASTAFSSINGTAEDVSNAMGNASAAFSKAADLDFSALKDGNDKYSKNITSLNGNIEAINSVFELQLGDFDTVIQKLRDSVKGANTYATEVNKLGQNLAALNDVYGKMLTAMNVKLA